MDWHLFRMEPIMGACIFIDDRWSSLRQGMWFEDRIRLPSQRRYTPSYLFRFNKVKVSRDVALNLSVPNPSR
jgi:hypothetical protein